MTRDQLPRHAPLSYDELTNGRPVLTEVTRPVRATRMRFDWLLFGLLVLAVAALGLVGLGVWKLAELIAA